MDSKFNINILYLVLNLYIDINENEQHLLDQPIPGSKIIEYLNKIINPSAIKSNLSHQTTIKCKTNHVSSHTEELKKIGSLIKKSFTKKYSEEKILYPRYMYLEIYKCILHLIGFNYIGIFQLKRDIWSKCYTTDCDIFTNQNMNIQRFCETSDNSKIKLSFLSQSYDNLGCIHFKDFIYPNMQKNFRNNNIIKIIKNSTYYFNITRVFSEVKFLLLRNENKVQKKKQSYTNNRSTKHVDHQFKSLIHFTNDWSTLDPFLNNDYRNNHWKQNLNKKRAHAEILQRTEMRKHLWFLGYMHDMLNSKIGLELFHIYLKSEFSNENLEFWMICNKYPFLPISKIKETVEILVEKYLKKNALHEINLDNKIISSTVQKLKNPDRY
ncbi:hypothetical protein A3Q56_05791 [Intoshia linei]|uniref:RGS domain-containing protein n=1 Tax=Intoshia linei TaxID=1819745 RepID=A0A177AX71_9BILA|nr:hypothetical protein A3Q56_05791 [Intoshia linei]